MSDAPLTSTWTKVNGLRLHALTGGPADDGGPPVVLVHGLGVSSRYMAPLARQLAATCRVLAPDLPGFGRSAKPPRTLDVPGLADALVGWLDAVGLGRVALVVNSLGCQVAVDCAARHPGRVDRLVLQGVTMDANARTGMQQIGRLAWAALREPPPVWVVVTWDYWRCGPLRALKTLRYGLADPIEAKLPRVPAPALVVHGQRDPISPLDWATRVAGLLPRGRLAVLPGAGHIPNYSQAAEYAALILPFLRGPV